MSLRMDWTRARLAQGDRSPGHGTGERQLRPDLNSGLGEEPKQLLFYSFILIQRSLKIFFYLLESHGGREEGRQRERQTDRGRLVDSQIWLRDLVDSSNDHKSQIWARLNPETRTSIQASHMGDRGQSA